MSIKNGEQPANNNLQRKLKQIEKFKKRNTEFKGPIYRPKYRPKRICATQDFVYEIKLPGDDLLQNEIIDLCCNQTKTSKILEGTVSDYEEHDFINKNIVTLVTPKIKQSNDAFLNAFNKRHKNLTLYEQKSLPAMNKKKWDIFTLHTEKEAENKMQRKIEKDTADTKTYMEKNKVNFDCQSENSNIKDPEAEKMYDILNKLNKEIEKIRKSHTDLKKKDYLHKTAIKSFKDVPGIGFKESEELKKMSYEFEASNYSKDLEKTKNTDEYLPRSLLASSASSDFPSYNLVKSNSRSTVFNDDISCNNAIKSDTDLANKLNTFNKFPKAMKSKPKISSEIDKGLENLGKYTYSSDTEDTWNTEINYDFIECFPTPEDVAASLKKFNISDCWDYKEQNKDSILKRENNDSIENDKSFVNDKIDQDECQEKESTIKENTQIDFAFNTTDIESQDAKAKDVIIHMCVNGVKKKQTNSSMGRLLKSEYLLKDRSLHPM
ncbi:uncharacterized protein [Prorops nasuta]|uniref:uncharacterized protein n=1 Tax=Prorops nasuta TaxID=863751 RepID=UPI0034CDC67C